MTKLVLLQLECFERSATEVMSPAPYLRDFARCFKPPLQMMRAQRYYHSASDRKDANEQPARKRDFNSALTFSPVAPLPSRSP